VPVAIWTSPDVAYVGLTEPEAKARYSAHEMVGSALGHYSETTKYAVDPHEGFIKLLFLRDGGRCGVRCALFGGRFG
jgi:pyruvate/2-oxoglutarate dehydrogenase complex dihydrolipoamide dehydrogenase (E3) component